MKEIVKKYTKGKEEEKKTTKEIGEDENIEGAEEMVKKKSKGKEGKKKQERGWKKW